MGDIEILSNIIAKMDEARKICQDNTCENKYVEDIVVATDGILEYFGNILHNCAVLCTEVINK